MLNINMLLERRYEIERELREIDNTKERLSKELQYLDGLLELNRNTKEIGCYETRELAENFEEAVEIEEEVIEEEGEYTRNLQGIRPKRSLRYEGEVFRYSKKGVLIARYKNPDEARNVLAEEEVIKLDIPFDENTTNASTIGYACTGTHNITGTGSNHLYKHNLWFDRELNEEEMETCRERKIFK